MSKSLSSAFPEYTVLTCIGEGALAKIYRVRRKADKELFAVKVISRKTLLCKGLSSSDEYVHHSRVSSHPNVVTLHERRTDLLYVYYLLDYIPGGNLYAIRKRVSVEAARSYARQIACALAHCHENDIIHNDVKLENVLVSKDQSTVYLADFGYSITSGQPRRMCGTIDYYCPYKAQNKLYDNKTDVWALGIIYHELLNKGKTPFEHEYIDQTLLQIRNDPYEPGDKMDPKDSEIISKMLCKTPSERPTAKNVVSMLKPKLGRHEAGAGLGPVVSASC